jgi:hypothetical protein
VMITAAMLAVMVAVMATGRAEIPRY